MRINSVIVFFILVICTFSCQKDSQSVDVNTQNTFTKSNPISSLILRVAQYPTALDNVIDGSSNFSIKLPIQITLDGYSLTVSSSSDFATVQDIKDYSNYDSDTVYIQLPFTIIYPNFQQVVITSQQQFDSIISQNSSTVNLPEIDCINFNYPVLINKFNTNNQIESNLTIHNDNEMYNFVLNLLNDEIVGIVYPLTLTNSNNQSVTITSNTQLEDAINNVIGTCDSSITNTASLSSILSSGTWHVSYYYDDYDNTNYFNGYNYTFNSNGSMLIQKNNTQNTGSWDIHTLSNYQRLDLNCNNSYLYELNQQWRVMEYNSNNVRLKYIENSNDVHYLNFTKN